MSIQIKMPALSSTADEGKIAKWLVKEGQRVRPGDIIAEAETDDSIIEIEAVEEGTIVKLLVPQGSASIKVNTPIAVLEQGTNPIGMPVRDAGTGGQSPAAPGPRLGTVPASSVAPTAVVRTRFKSTLAPAPGAKVSPAAATAIAAPAAAPARTTYMRGQDMQTDPVTGWLVVVKGPGRGSYRAVFPGMNAIGRDASQRISLSFGDDTISRQEHAFVIYDDEQRRFFLQHGGKANLIRVGDQPVLVPTELKAGDKIRIGKTTLLFVPLCSADFSWSEDA